MISCACERSENGKTRSYSNLILQPAPDDLRRHRGGRPGIHHIQVWRRRTCSRRCRRAADRFAGIDRQLGWLGGDDLAALAADPDREGHAKGTLRG